MPEPEISRIARGAKVYAGIFGMPEAEVPRAFSDRVSEIFAAEAMYAAGGAMWAHPALTDRDRSIAVITALVSQGVVDGDRLETHLRKAVGNGLDHDALSVLMTLVAAYAGYPKASLAAEAVEAFFRE